VERKLKELNERELAGKSTVDPQPQAIVEFAVQRAKDADSRL
jgi:hypothetical protein